MFCDHNKQVIISQISQNIGEKEFHLLKYNIT